MVYSSCFIGALLLGYDVAQYAPPNMMSAYVSITRRVQQVFSSSTRDEPSVNFIRICPFSAFEHKQSTLAVTKLDH